MKWFPAYQSAVEKGNSFHLNIANNIMKDNPVKDIAQEYNFNIMNLIWLERKTGRKYIAENVNASLYVC